MPGSIFLSHSHADNPFVRNLFLDLESRGIKAWLDEAEIRPGDSLIAKIEEGIEVMDYLGVVLSPNSVESEWVLHEVRMALTQEIRGKTVKVIPLLIENCKLPGFLMDKLYIDFRDQNERSYQKNIDSLVLRLQGEKPEIPKSNRLKFIDSLQSVPDDARVFDKEFANTNVLSLSRALNDEQFDALHDLRKYREDNYDTVFAGRYYILDTGIIEPLAIEAIGGHSWQAARILNELVQFGFLSSDPDYGYGFTVLFWQYTNLMQHLRVGHLRSEDALLGSEYWLSPRN